MSRGPGVLQRRVLEALAAYERLGSSLQWQWRSSNPAGSIADQHDIRAYETGRRVPVWILRRDLECARSDLSRALTSLDRQGFVWRFDWDLQMAGERFGAKTASSRASQTKARIGLSANKYRVQKLALNKYIANRRATAILALCHNDETADGSSHVFSGSNTRQITQHTAYRALSVGSSADTRKAYGSVAGTRYFSAWVLHDVSVVDNPANRDCRFAILRGH